MNELNQRIADLSPEKRELLLQRIKKEQPLARPPAAIPRREAVDPLPLSFAQQRLWFLDQLEPNNPFYNIPVGVQLNGPLNVDALKLSFNEIVRYHETLRTSFKVVNGQPAQVIRPTYAPALPLVDLRELDDSQREAEAHRLAVAEAQRPFDLAGDQLFRNALICLREDSHNLLLTMHHIISDGWSKGVLLRDLVLLYQAYSQGHSSPLSELEIQYADYALWQRQHLQGEMLHEQLQYWKQQLGDSSEALELPADHPRPANRTYQGTRLQFALSKELTEALKQLSRSEGVTLFMLLAAAFQTLLHRYSQQQQISIGTPVAGRTRTETEPLIGFFLNTLVLRTDFAGDPSFAELLQRVKTVALGAYAHQEVPFEKLVEEIEVERSLSHTPLFQTMLVFENTPTPAYTLSDLSLAPVGVSTGTSIFDLTLYMGEEPQSLTGAWEYSTELFEEATVKQLLDHFERLLHGIVAEPQQRISRLPLLSEAEREQLLVEWNQTAREYESQQCLQQLIAEQAARQPNAVAVSCGSEQLSYRELNEQANQLAHHLRALGVGPETITGVCLERSVRLPVALLGILKAGGAYLPLDPEYPLERLSFMLADSGAPVLITERQWQQHFSEQALRAVVLEEEQEAIASCARSNPESEVGPGNLAYVIYTSGSTGQPKGVMIAHANLSNFLLSMREQPGLAETDKLVAVTTFSFDIAGLELWLPLMVGARLWLAESWQAADPAGLRELLERSGATVMQATPVTWRMLLDGGWRAGREFKVLCGGEALSGALAAELVAQSRAVWNLYGPTETTIWSTQQAVGELAGELAAELAETSVVPLGRPLANTQVYVLGRQLEVLPPGVVGELYLGGAGVARGYLGRAELTAEKFVPDPYGAAGGRLYRTGDLVRWTSSGQLEFIGRRDEQIKLRGFRIELGEIESALKKCPGVRLAIALVRRVTDLDQRLVAYVVAEAGADVSIRSLREQLKGRLPEYMIPAELFLLDELPLTPNGKIDRRALAALQQNGSSEKPFEPPRTPVEEMLAPVWAELLRVERVGVADNFFELGGHSLLATQLVSRVREVFEVEISLRSLFEQITLGDLAQRIEEELRAGNGLQGGTIVPIPRDGELPLSFAQQRLWFLDQLEPGTIAYNMPVAVRLGGPLQIDALERALNEVVRRQEGLRTSFGVADGSPVQIISEARPMDLCLIDLSDLPEDQRNERVKELAVAEGLRPFKLSEGRLLRVGLIRLSGAEHVLLLTMHHIVSDGWSMSVLVREVSILYEAFAAQRPSPLEELKTQYVDFAHWQREWLRGEVLDTQLTYWREQLAGAPPMLELPTDRPRPTVQSLNGAAESLSLPTELTKSLKELSRQEGATLFMTLLAAFQLLLSRYSSQTDIVVGSAIANRNRAEIEPLVGFFINSLVLRTRLDGDPTFRELLHRVRETALGAYAHQDLPFEMLVDHLQPQRDLSRSPLFQVMFTLQNTPHQAVALSNSELTLTPLESPATTAKFDFEINVSDLPEGLALSCEYNTDLYDAVTIERMLGHFGNLLRAAVAEPERSISELPLLGDEERRELLVQSAGEVAPVADVDRFEEHFRTQAQRTPGAVALSCGERRVTYRELDELTDCASKRLLAAGVRHETVIGLLSERSIEWITAVLAILKSGGVYLPLDARHPPARLAQIVAQGGARLVLSGNGLEAKMREALDGSNLVDVVSLAELLSAGRTPPQPDEINGRITIYPSQLAYIIFTSGSTGAPKGAMIEQRGMFNHLAAKIRELDLRPDDCVAQTASPSFDISVWQVLAPLAAGARVEVIPDEMAHDPVALLREIERARVTVLELVPSMLRAVLQELSEGDRVHRPQLRNLRWLMVTGEVLEAKLCRQWLAEYAHVPLVNAYGPTECSDDVTHQMVIEQPVDEEREIPLGHVLDNLRIDVLNNRGQLLPEGVWGELYVGGAGVGRGYAGRADLTAERFVPDEYSGEAGARLYRTGDIGRWRRGKLEYGGRVDEQVKIRGQRIELGEVESVLGAHETVRECAVIVRDDREGHKQLTAYVIPHRPPQDANSQERHRVEAEKVEQWEKVFDDVRQQREVSERDSAILRRYMQERLPEYMVPSAFMILDQLPLTSNGKLDRRGLPAPDTTRHDPEQTFIEPDTPAEQTLARIWREVLGLEQVGIHDNFFVLGGDSILSIQIVSRAARAGLHLTPKDLFQHQTVAALAAAARTTGGVAAEQGIVTGEVQLTPVQHWFLTRDMTDPHHYNQAIMLAVSDIDATLLGQVVKRLVEHHDALRLRFEPTTQGWRQWIVAEDTEIFTRVDLSQFAPAEQPAKIEAVATQVQAGLNLSRGPVARVVLMDLGPGRGQRLLMAIHHLAVDGVSWRILLEDLQGAYEQISRGAEIRLPAKTTSFKEWARQLRQYSQSEAIKFETSHWLDPQRRLVAPLPVDRPADKGAHSSARVVSVALSAEETRQLLHDVPGVYHTQIDDVLLTALARAVSAWTEQEQVLVDLEGHGREPIDEAADVTRTVGWFTAIYPVLLRVSPGAGIGESLKGIKEQLRAVPQRGIGYGLLRYLHGDDELSRKLQEIPEAQLSFNYLGQLDQVLSADSGFAGARESSGESRSGRGEREYLLDVVAGISEEQLQLSWVYSETVHRRETIERIAADCVKELREIISHCLAPQAGGFTPSDFPYAQLDQDTLDRVMTAVNKRGSSKLAST
jgi:amino acid adenylation domain-containing protein/non-ribosomal peptide synthase protein (TIGR01720 family)